MNDTQFIEKAFFGNTRRSASNNIFKDGENNIYSYGYHYPLLFRAHDEDSIYFLNKTSYSNTTAKHQQKAYTAMDGEVIEVKLNGARLPLSLQKVLELLTKERDEIKMSMDGKKRKDTQVYKYLESDLAKVEKSRAYVVDSLVFNQMNGE